MADGLLDFLNTPAGMGLLSGVASYAANARRGAPINSLGRGLAGGLMGYQQAQQGIVDEQQAAMEREYKQAMTKAQIMNAETAAENAKRKRQAMETEAKGAETFLKTIMPGTYQYTANTEDYDVTPTWSDIAQPIKVNAEAAQTFGMDQDAVKRIMTLAQTDPKFASRLALEEYKRVTKAKNEAKDVLAKDRAMAEARGMTLRQFYEMKDARPSGVNVRVENVMPGEASKKAGGKEGYDIGEQTATIENKYAAIDSIRDAREMLKGGIYAGFWGPKVQKMAKISGGAIGDMDKVVRTEKYMSYIGNVVIPRLQEFGGNDSVEELKYLRSVMAGDQELEPESIDGILDSAERKVQRGIERLQRQRKALEEGRMPELDAGPSRQPVKPVQKMAPKTQAPAEQGGWSIKKVP